MPEYKKVPNNENVIELDGKVILSFDPRYKEYLKWRDENPELEQQLVKELKEDREDLPLQNSSKEPDNPESWPLPPYTFNWKNGNKMVKGNFHGNRIEGTWMWYYENGNIQSEINYENGFKDGLFKLYYKNGNIKVQGKYKKDNRNGVWLINGKKRKFRNGKEL